MKRREFVKRVPTLTSGVLAGLSILSLDACGGVSYIVPARRVGGLGVPAAVLEERRAIFVQAPNMERPIYLRLAETGPIALLASCTHRGCQPEPVGPLLICPCHGSEFSSTGAVSKGPAEQPLTRYEVSRDGADFVIHIEAGR
jgi:nitrite reductase/ring-hydroxylating ferredoxin subunit